MEGVDEVAAGFNHSAATFITGTEVCVWGKNMSQTPQGKPRDVFLPLSFTLPRPVVAVACSSHQTFVLLNDNSVHGHGIYKDGGGRVTTEFVEVWAPGGETVELFGGHRATVVVGGREAWVLELDAGDSLEVVEGEEGENEGEGEVEEDTGFVPHARRAEWLPEGGLGEGLAIRSVATGWDFGVAEIEEV